MVSGAGFCTDVAAAGSAGVCDCSGTSGPAGNGAQAAINTTPSADMSDAANRPTLHTGALSQYALRSRKTTKKVLNMIHRSSDNDQFLR